MNDTTQLNRIDDALVVCKKAFGYAFLFSFFINIFALASPLYTLQIFDRVLSSGSLDTLLLLSIIIFVIYLILGVMQLIRSFVFMQVSSWIDQELTPELLLATLRVSAVNRKIGASQAQRDLGSIKGFISGQSIHHIFDLPWTPIYLVVLWLIHPYMGLIALASALFLLTMAWVNESQTKGLFEKANEKNIQIYKQIETAARNSEVAIGMGMFGKLVDRLSKDNKGATHMMYRATAKSTSISTFTRSFRMVIQMLAMALSTYLVLQNRMTPGGIIAVSILSGKMLAPFDGAIGTWKAVVMTRKAYDRLKKLVDAVPFKQDAIELPDPEGELTLEGVSFATPDTRKPIIKGVSAKIGKGEIIGMIGPSAAGKSSLARLMVGVWRPSNGTMRLDSADIHDWDREKVGRFLGFMPQEIELFSGTVKENIARMDAEFSDEDVIEAAQFAGAHELILKLPNGYETEIGVLGAHISAGQRQRIALARCFYKKPKVVILDEPNSHLDQPGETALMETIDRAKLHGITTVIISHRPSVLSRVDKIMVLVDGQIQQFGPRDEVLKAVTPGAKS